MKDLKIVIARRIKKKERDSFFNFVMSVHDDKNHTIAEMTVRPTKMKPKLMFNLKTAYKAIKGKGKDMVLINLEYLPPKVFSE
jgi:hypothetical protein